MSPPDPAEHNEGIGENAHRLAICVFCGSRSGSKPAVVTAAWQVGALIGKLGHELVYGGSGSGLMGEVARAAHMNGAPITGYVPRHIYEREIGIELPQQTLHITNDLFERKRRMIERADAFIALPGGYGTLDEICEILSRTYLSVLAKPLILLNTDGYWNGLAGLVNSLHEAGFANNDKAGRLFRITGSPDEAISMAEDGAMLAARPSADVAG